MVSTWSLGSEPVFPNTPDGGATLSGTRCSTGFIGPVLARVFWRPYWLPVFPTRLVKSLPAVPSGFEVEAELAVDTSQLRFPFAEVLVSYRTCPAGSTSEPSSTAVGSVEEVGASAG